jgi:ubiquitin-conjugating enzyme E2 J2
MSDYHPESWNPAWSVGTLLQGLQSFMVDTENATGCVYCTTSQIEAYCKASKHWNSTYNQRFKKHFPELISPNLEDLIDNADSLNI